MSKDSFERYGKTVEVNRQEDGKFGEGSGVREQLTKRLAPQKMSADERKQRQVDIIQKYNPKDPTINAQATWVESVKDVQNWEEVMNDDNFYGEGCTPDFKWEDAQKAQESGYVMVYSSHPIKQGTWVTPSKMLAQSYGAQNPYSKYVPVDSVAWIDMSEGQYANIDEEGLSDEKKRALAKRLGK